MARRVFERPRAATETGGPRSGLRALRTAPEEHGAGAPRERGSPPHRQRRTPGGARRDRRRAYPGAGRRRAGGVEAGRIQVRIAPDRGAAMQMFKVRVTTAGGAEQVTEYRTMAPAARWFLQWVGNPAGDAELSDGTGTWRPDADDPRVLVRTDGWRYKVPEAPAGKRSGRSPGGWACPS